MGQHKNFTAFKVYVSIYDNVMDDIEDRLINDRQKLRAKKKVMKEAVSEWCENNEVLTKTGYKARFDQYCGCSCPCSPGFRVTVNEDDVHKSGFFQLYSNMRGRKGPKDIWIDMNEDSKNNVV